MLTNMSIIESYETIIRERRTNKDKWGFDYEKLIRPRQEFDLRLINNSRISIMKYRALGRDNKRLFNSVVK